MDERRFRAALEELTATIEGYGEETVIAAFRTVLDRFDYEIAKRDPGPCCPYGEFYDGRGVMVPIHECPSERPDAWVDDLDPTARAAVHAVIDMRRQWS